eukprot:COSAG01_NODE_10411_length_2173_cov_1.449373_3_plen_216_part_00
MLGAVKELADLEVQPVAFITSFPIMLKFSVAPLGLLLWATFETQALQRVPAGKNPWTTESEINAEVVWKRIAQNSFEQTLVTFMCAVSLMTLGGGKVGSFEATRFAIAHVYMYIIGRIGFAIGYLKTMDAAPIPGIGRVPGLLIGGFWLNAAYFFLGVLIIFGFPNTAAVFYSFAVLLGVVVPVIIFFVLPGGGEEDAKAEETAPITDSSAEQQA